MIPPYEIFLRSEAIVALRAIRPSARAVVSKFIDSLATEPFSEGDYSVKDHAGRDIHIKVVAEWAVTFWSDHPAKEIKIIDIRSADRA